MKVLIVDGYNVIFAWPELAQLLERDTESAREQLIAALTPLADWEVLSVIVVFDAGSTDNPVVEMEFSTQLTILFTRKGQSADSLIEELVRRMSSSHAITVATSDRAEGDLARFLGSRVISAAQLQELVTSTRSEIATTSNALAELAQRNRLEDAVSQEVKALLNAMRFR